MINVLFFAQLADLSKAASAQVSHQSGITVRSVVDELEKEMPQELINSLRFDANMVSVNQVLADWDDSLNDGDEIAFLPPFSGG